MQYGTSVRLTGGPFGVLRENEFVEGVTIGKGWKGIYLAEMPSPPDASVKYHAIGVKVNGEELMCPVPEGMFEEGR